MEINPNDPKPIYLQIIDYLKMAVLSGRYRDGDRIPPVRELAMQLRINPNTVAKAYKIMQDSGMLSARPGGGSFIVAPEAADAVRQRTEALAEDIAGLIQKADALGVPREKLVELLATQLKKDETR